MSSTFSEKMPKSLLAFRAKQRFGKLFRGTVFLVDISLMRETFGTFTSNWACAEAHALVVLLLSLTVSLETPTDDIPPPEFAPYTTQAVPVIKVRIHAHSAPLIDSMTKGHASIPFILMVIGTIPLAVASSVYVPSLLLAVFTVIIKTPGIGEASFRDTDRLLRLVGHQPLKDRQPWRSLG